jgi:hypothetical protein
VNTYVLPPDFERRVAMAERIAQQHHVDIQRLWKGLPIEAWPQVGLTSGGLAEPVIFVEPTTSTTTTSTTTTTTTTAAITCTAFNSPSFVLDQGGPGAGWSNVSNILADDSNYATTNITGTASSRPISVTHFGFSVPGSASVREIHVEIKAHKSSSIDDGSVRAAVTVDGSTELSSYFSDAVSTTDSVITLVIPSSAFTAIITSAQINQDGFGVIVRVASQDNTGTGTDINTISIDYVKVKVCYIP